MTRLFADDCLIYRNIVSESDESLLQEDLNNLTKWADSWGMRFNTGKCKTMQLSRKCDPGEPKYEMSGVSLEATKDNTYLGIIIQNDLGWGRQTQHAVTKPSRIPNFIKCNFYS